MGRGAPPCVARTGFHATRRTAGGRAGPPSRTARLAIVLPILSLAFVPPSSAQERVAFRHLGTAEGLSQNAVYAIAQDRSGFVWLGTKDGLNRYDGYGFEIFRYDPSDSLSPSFNDVSALFVDRDGRLWVGFRGGALNRYDPVRQAFVRYRHAPPRPVNAIAEDREGNLWIGTDGAGLYRLTASRLDRPDALFERFAHDADRAGSLSNDRVHDLLVDRAGELWVGTGSGLDRLVDPASPETGFLHYGKGPPESGGLTDRTATALLQDSGGRLWVGGVEGLTVLDPDRERATHHYHRYRTYRRGWGEAVDLLEDRAGRIWVATYTELMRLDPASGTFDYFRPDRFDPASISGEAPMALLEDRSGVLWVGTNGYGVNLHDPKAGRFHTFRRPEDRPWRISGFPVYALFEDSRSTVWIGAGVLYRWDRGTGAFESFETTPERPRDFGNTGVWSFVESPRGVLWVGTYEGLYRYDVDTGRYRLYRHDPDDPGSLPEPIVFDVFEDRDGTMWVVTENHLARLVDPDRGRFRSYPTHDPPTHQTWTLPSTLQDLDGTLWLGSNQGLLAFDPESETLRRFRHDPNDPASLAHDGVRSLLLDPARPDRYLWVGTAGGGLGRFDLESGRLVERFTTADGLPNDVVYGILPDDGGNLWLSTNRGLSRFDPRAGTFRNYDAGDGLQSDEFNSGAYFRSARGELFFGGIEGFNHFFPGEIEDNPHVPPVVITAFRRGNRYERVRDTASALAVAVSEADSLRLSHRDDVITFEFAALDFSAPEKNRYAYRLVGHNDEWIESGDVRSATFTNLPPGEYVFEVRGSNNDGVWNEVGASLALAIAPPWWRTGWAYALYGTLAMAALLFARRYEMSRIRLRNRLALERVEAEKFRDLDRARSRFFANVSHEFRTPLTLTLGPLDDLRSGLHGPLAPAMEEQVDLARRNAGRVLELINQILDVARLEAGRTPLRARRLDPGALVSEVARAFVPMAERRGLDLEVRVSDPPLEAFVDPEHLERAVSNLLSNAMKFTPEGGTVRVTVEGDDEAVRIVIEDTGPGIPADELERVFDRFHRVELVSSEIQPGTGIGLALTRELVELHGGRVDVESEPGSGSAFTVTLRRGRGHLTDDQVVDGDDASPWSAGAAAPADAGSGARAVNGAAPADGSPNGVAPADDVTTVLVVEDHPEVRAYVRSHLAPRYRVLEAVDGEEALPIVRERLPDLVLSDVMMPGMDGFALCRAIKEDPETDFIPVVLLTARAGTEDRLTGLEGRADDYLVKPFEIRELLARVENLIASRKRLLERFAGSAPALHPRAVEVEPEDERFLERVRDAVEEGLGDETFTVERLAEAVALSRSQLHRRLRDLVDESPSEVIVRMRLERAAQLIEADAGAIGEVAYSVGFKSVSHFSNRFLDRFGVRPSAYRTERAR